MDRRPFRLMQSTPRARKARGLAACCKDQSGEIDTLLLIIILVAPLIIFGGVAFLLIIAYVNRVARVTAELEAGKSKPKACPACGHEPAEARRFCPECGALVSAADSLPAQESWDDPGQGA